MTKMLEFVIITQEVKFLYFYQFLDILYRPDIMGIDINENDYN